MVRKGIVPLLLLLSLCWAGCEEYENPEDTSDRYRRRNLSPAERRAAEVEKYADTIEEARTSILDRKEELLRLVENLGRLRAWSAYSHATATAMEVQEEMLSPQALEALRTLENFTPAELERMVAAYQDKDLRHALREIRAVLEAPEALQDAGRVYNPNTEQFESDPLRAAYGRELARVIASTVPSGVVGIYGQTVEDNKSILPVVMRIPERISQADPIASVAKGLTTVRGTAWRVEDGTTYYLDGKAVFIPEEYQDLYISSGSGENSKPIVEGRFQTLGKVMGVNQAGEKVEFEKYGVDVEYAELQRELRDVHAAVGDTEAVRHLGRDSSVGAMLLVAIGPEQTRALYDRYRSAARQGEDAGRALDALSGYYSALLACPDSRADTWGATEIPKTIDAILDRRRAEVSQETADALAQAKEDLRDKQATTGEGILRQAGEITWDIPSSQVADLEDDHPMARACGVVYALFLGGEETRMGVGFGPKVSSKDDELYGQYKAKVAEVFLSALEGRTGVNIREDFTQELNGVEYDRYYAADGTNIATVLIGIQDGHCVSYWLAGPSGSWVRFRQVLGKATLQHQETP